MMFAGLACSILFGVVMGSFAGAQVWRLRAAQLKADKSAKRPVDKKEYERLRPLLSGSSLSSDRSRCLSCSHQLAWYDLLPIVSWLTLRGKCRYCKQPIGRTELAVELGLGALFGLSVILWPEPLNSPLELIKLALWLAALVSLTINLIYDARWLLLDSRLNWLLIGLGVVYVSVSATGSVDPVGVVLSAAGAVLLLSGLYALLWLVSRGRWVGEGDIYLGAGLALFLGTWQLSFVALFAANLIGTVIIAPGLLSGKLGRGSQVPFGPLLIAGAILTWFVGDSVVDWYQSLLFV